jgi:catechol 2,3-dioxygenase-like lactoylglutathione lyase family enzyme
MEVARTLTELPSNANDTQSHLSPPGSCRDRLANARIFENSRLHTLDIIRGLHLRTVAGRLVMQAHQVLATVAVSDFATSSAWYARLFGRAPDHSTDNGCAEWQIAGRAALQLRPRDASQPDGQLHASVGIMVADLDEALAELRVRHIEVTPPQVATHFLRFAPIADPDGNLVTFVESAAG